jgi:hypothetical protein
MFLLRRLDNHPNRYQTHLRQNFTMNSDRSTLTEGSSQSRYSNYVSLPQTPNLVQHGAPRYKLPDGMVIPYIAPADMGLSPPTGGATFFYFTEISL